MMGPTKEQVDELVGNLRFAECEADRMSAGCDLAVLLHQAERMITILWHQQEQALMLMRLTSEVYTEQGGS